MFVKPEIACGIMEAIGSIEAKDNYCDFTVVVEGKRFSCHRFILNACSGFFSALFRSGMKETLESTVTVYGIPSEIFAQILDCLYKGVEILTEENVIEMWHATNLLQINFLIAQCEKFVVNNFLPEHYSEIYRHAKLLDSKSVLKAALEVMIKDFGSFSYSSTFVHLYPSDLLALLESSDLNVPCEDIVVNAILKWVSYSSEEANGVGGSSTSELWYEKKTKRLEAKLEGGSNDGNEESGERTDSAQKDDDKANGEDTATENGITNKSLENEGSNMNSKDTDTMSTLATATKPRKEYLGKLLAACRICLISPDCIEKLMCSDLIMESKDALAAVKEAVLYHLRPGQYWPPAAVHRVKSKMENVAVFIDDKLLRAYSMRNDRLYTLSGLPEVGDGSGSLRVANNQIFLTRTGGGYYASSFAIHAFIEPTSWCKVIDNSDTPYFVIPLEDFIYMVKGSSLYRFGTKQLWADKTPTKGICNLPINLYNHTTPATATFGKKILLFCGSNSSIMVTVLCINTQTFKTTVKANYLDGPAEKMVCFGNGKDTFILQMNGTLLQIVDDPEEDVKFQFLTKLWGFDWNLQGAIAYNKQLFLFGTAPQGERSWSQSLPGYFDEIKVVYVQSRCQCYPAIVPKQWMTEKTA